MTEIYWINSERAKAKGSFLLGISPRPRGGDWLADEIAAWHAAGVDTVVSLLESNEVSALELEQEEVFCQKAGVQFISFPILDRGVPQSNSEARQLLDSLDQILTQEKRVLIHCRQGIGRAGMIAASLLAQRGVKPEAAAQEVSLTRGTPVPETPEQREWIDAILHFPLASPSASRF